MTNRKFFLMNEISRNLDTPEARAFWANIDKVEEQIKRLPKWMQDELAKQKKNSEDNGS